MSDDTKSLLSKIYIFSFLCISVKYLSINAISFSGLDLTISNSSVLTGSLAISACALTFASIPCIIRDYLLTRSKDQILISEVPALDELNFSTQKSGNLTFIERHFRKIQMLSWITFAIEAVFPIILGIVVAVVARQDMLTFLQTITK